MKNEKYKNKIIIAFFIIQLIGTMLFNNAIVKAETLSTSQEKYDVILFWGQSNMTGYCGLYNTDEKAKQKGSNNEIKADPRYNYLDNNSVTDYANKTGIDKEFLSKSVQMNYVKISQEANTVFDYNYITNSLVELNENTKYIGELLKYDSTSKKLIKPIDYTSYSIQKSYGTNIVPQFCKSYYQKTGHKVVAVLASNGGEKISNFLPSTDSDYGDQNKQMIYEAMVEKYKSAIKYLESKGYTVENRFWVSFQGEADVTYKTSTSEYKRLFLKVHNNLKRDLNITKGTLIQTSTLIGKDNYKDVLNIHNAQIQLSSENNDIVLGSTYAYDRFVPDKTNYNSANYSSNIYINNNGSKLEYEEACKIAKLSMSDPGNTIHFTSAALSQIGKETAISLANSISKTENPSLNPSSSISDENKKIYMYDKIESDGSDDLKTILNYFKSENEDVYIRIKVGTNASTSSKNTIIKNVVDLVNNYNMQNKVYYTSNDRELLKLIKNYNANANFNYEIDKWNWNGSDSIISFINSLKNGNNKVSVEIDKSIYKDTIAQTLKYNEIEMIVKVYSLADISSLDKSVHKIIILDDKINSESSYEYANALTNHFYDYTAVNPSDVVNYQILAKDNCGVMFQTIQNVENSNIRLYTNVPAKDESLFKFKKISENQYMIISKKNSFAISAKDNNNNSKLILVKQNPSDKKQIWKIIHNSNGTASFVNVATGKAIQPEQDTQKMKYNLIQSTYVKDKSAQSFYLYSDEVRIQTSAINIYLGNSNTAIEKINFSYSVNKKITEKDVINTTKNQINNEIKKKLTDMGLKNGQYIINVYKDNSHSVADDLIHYYIKIKINIPDFPSTDYAIEALTHRGYNTAPESTLAAFWMARINGFHYSGADVRVTKDGVPVIFHDTNLSRTARTSNGGSVSSSIKIENLTYAEAMKYDYGIYKNAVWKGKKIPTLEEYIKLCKELGLVTNLHLKPDGNINKNTLQTIVNIINKYDMRDSVYYASEEKSILNNVKSLDKNANFDFLVLKEWNWDGANSIVSYVESLKTGNNRVEIGLNKSLYKDTIAQTMEYNGIRLTTSANTTDELLSYDKSVDVMSTDTLSPTVIQNYALKRTNKIGTYIKTAPKESINYNILAKDNCGVMFQTIQNIENSNIRLYTNVPTKDESLFKFKKVSENQYMIISKKNTFAISAKDYNNNSRLILAKQNQSDKKQLWKMINNSNGTVSFVNVATGKAIQPEQDTQKMKYNLIQSTYNNNKNAQQFFIKE